MANSQKMQPPQDGLHGAGDIPDRLMENVEAIVALDAREAHQMHPLQKLLDALGHSLEQPLFVALIALFVAAWIVVNLFAGRVGITAFDAPPFPWLQGVIGVASFVTMVLVLIKQNRKAQQDRRRDQLQLQLIMLTEVKVAKLIGLMEELRRDLPTIDDRLDPEAEKLKRATHPQAVLDAIEEKSDPSKE
ncbi:MAG TPA: DUF1003 domain-containing protein [Burkholderiaceae bacterium]|jgi:uncharacterized membrane protein